MIPLRRPSPPPHTGVLLLQLGGPDSLDAVEPFLENLFRDPFLVRIPFLKGPLRRWFARAVSRRRAPHVRKLYSEIGGRSPIRPLTEALPLAEVDRYPDDLDYLDALASTVQEALRRFPDPARVHVLFSAHGIPMSLVRRGDPYEREIHTTVAGVLRRLPAGQDWSLSFQSKVGPVKWLEPATAEHLPALARQGIREVLVVPVAFVSDHIETLH